MLHSITFTADYNGKPMTIRIEQVNGMFGSYQLYIDGNWMGRFVIRDGKWVLRLHDTNTWLTSDDIGALEDRVVEEREKEGLYC